MTLEEYELACKAIPKISCAEKAHLEEDALARKAFADIEAGHKDAKEIARLVGGLMRRKTIRWYA